MNMQMGVIGVVVLLALAGGVFLLSEDTNVMMEKDKAMMEKEVMEKDVMMKEDVMTKDEGVMEKKEDGAMKKEETMMKGDAMTVKGSIQNYSADKLALADKGKVLLFFHAPWCPICRQLDTEAAANPTIVPDGVTVLKVDYDSETALKQKYGVTVQHTFVQVDSKGMLVKKFSDASNYSTVFGKVQ